MLDLTPTAQRVAALVAATGDAHLDAPTPCPELAVRNLLAHLGTLAIAFTDAAHKVDGPHTSTPPDPTTAVLADDWRTAIPDRLTVLAEAWQDPQAWQGMTRAGGLEMPAAEAGLVALDELVLHGWDLAAAISQPYQVEPAALDAVEQFCAAIPDDASARDGGLFGPRVPVAEDAPQLDRVLGLAGRDPAWSR